MRRITVVAVGLLCLSALKAYSQIAEAKSVESAKADSGLRFLESGKGRSGVGEPSSVRAPAATSHASGLTTSIDSKRPIGSLQVPVPAPAAAAQKEVPASSSDWSKWKIGGAIVGGVTGVLSTPALAASIPIAAVVLISGICLAAGAAIGYGAMALAERAARRAE